MTSVVTDIATRVYDHTYSLDPIHRSALDQDFYKLLMAQLIWRRHRDVQATFSLINRTTHIRLAREIPESELRAQLDHARTVHLTRGEATWLRGNTFYGERQIFSPGFIEWFEGFRLPLYELRIEDDQYVLDFPGAWLETTMWEIPALAIISELRSRAVMRRMSRFEIDVVYARAKSKLWQAARRLRVLKGEGPLRISDFGTRRRHSFLWQRWATQAMIEALGDSFIGTSNAKMAHDNDLEAIGTNAHELPMVYAALTDSDEALRQSRYEVLKDWAEDYSGNLLILLARHLRHDRFPARRTGLGDGLARYPARLEIAARSGGGGSRLVALQGRRPPRKTRRAVGRHGCRFHREHCAKAAGPHRRLDRLGHQPHQRFPRLRGGAARPRCDLARVQDHRLSTDDRP